MVSVLKQAEDGGDLILRAYETTQSSAHAEICSTLWGDRVIQADFKPSEIKTFRVPKDPTRPIVETNLVEW